MRFVEDMGVRSPLPHPPQQIEIGDETAPASDYRPIVLNLARHEDMAPLACRALENRMTMAVFSEARGDDQQPQLTRSRQECRIELAVLKQRLEFAWS